MDKKNDAREEDLHFRVLKQLQDDPHLSQRELAKRLGVSNGKLHYCMRALMDKGLVKLGNFAHSKHRLGYAYLLTPAGMASKAAMAGAFLKRKMAEYEALRREIESLQGEMQSGLEIAGAEREKGGRLPTQDDMPTVPLNARIDHE